MSSTSVTPAPKTIDPRVILQNLGAMRTTNRMFNSALNDLQECGQQVKEMCPTLEGASEQIGELSRKVDAQDALTAEQMEGIREKVKGDYKSDALARMTEHFQNLIKSEVKRQVKVQMDEQMYPKHLSRPLQDEITEGRAQVTAMEAALQNSKSRRKNAALTWANPTEPFAPIVFSNGEKSALWPADANSLVQYTAEDMSKLMKDYELHDYGNSATNFNRFMAFIGAHQIDAPVGMRGV
ncbi:hypothetical protein C8Q73DRAFT_479005 [Cubamyces lactineus]|nr:hypothetical protein C8Q73DRAFT_479005 [Cubamyces lactineus]